MKDFGELLLYGVFAAGVICALGLAFMAVRWFVRGWRAEQQSARSVRIVITIR